MVTVESGVKPVPVTARPAPQSPAMKVLFARVISAPAAWAGAAASTPPVAASAAAIASAPKRARKEVSMGMPPIDMVPCAERARDEPSVLPVESQIYACIKQRRRSLQEAADVQST